MRINKYIASATGLSRRAADSAIAQGRVLVNGQKPDTGYIVQEADIVTLDNQRTTPAVKTLTIMLNKPPGYVCSRDGQGSKTVYDLLPTSLHSLKPIGRLDKESSGLLLLTNDGQLAFALTHPSHQKVKVYQIRLDHSLQPLHQQMISDHGIQLDDGPSRLILERLHENNNTEWVVSMHEGRNRQIRRTFAAVGYTVTKLHRTQFGTYHLGSLPQGSYTEIN